MQANERAFIVNTQVPIRGLLGTRVSTFLEVMLDLLDLPV